ncbi:hypothetical protein [Cupriavidus sp. DL-D2]|uniref:hypothetical protein n=1 Tax=Cupriavidus sp. DL-D2 TaxID=3144974 RepID=UPI0032149F8E
MFILDLLAYLFILLALASVPTALYFLILPGKGRLPWLRRLYWLGCICLFFLGGYPMYFLAAEGTGGALFGMAMGVFLLGAVMTLLGVVAKAIYAGVQQDRKRSMSVRNRSRSSAQGTPNSPP